ncbi:MAG: hypothetical protein L0206_23100, partial [Actinobacteria bacterium]|nr:hypothetical protein [Actinomycetota bacterium]
GWSLDPGSGAGGSADSETAATGPIQGSASNALPGVTSTGSATADYGALTLRTTTTVNASQQTGASFCLPPHCSDAEAWWADRLVFRAPGHVANGSPGSFTATLRIMGDLHATLSNGWSFVTVASVYQASVEIDHALWEQIGANCIDVPGPMNCFPVTLQVYYGNPPASTMHPDPFGSFAVGPYDFTWGETFDVEVRVRGDALLDSAAQNSGTSSADADLRNGVVFVGVDALFAGAGGTGGQVPLGSATVSVASGVDWLKTVPVPEPRGSATSAGALALVAGLARVRRRRSRCVPRS